MPATGGPVSPTSHSGPWDGPGTHKRHHTSPAPCPAATQPSPMVKRNNDGGSTWREGGVDCVAGHWEVDRAVALERPQIRSVGWRSVAPNWAFGASTWTDSAPMSFAETSLKFLRCCTTPSTRASGHKRTAKPTARPTVAAPQAGTKRIRAPSYELVLRLRPTA